MEAFLWGMCAGAGGVLGVSFMTMAIQGLNRLVNEKKPSIAELTLAALKERNDIGRDLVAMIDTANGLIGHALSELAAIRAKQ